MDTMVDESKREPSRRRRSPEAQKRQIVAETPGPGASVSLVAGRHDVNANLLFNWRRQQPGGMLTTAADSPAMVPVRNRRPGPRGDERRRTACRRHAVPVLAPDHGKTRTGRLWVYVRDDRPTGSATPPAVLFRYTPDRKGERPAEHLKGFAGALQPDGYTGFDRIYHDASIAEVACWAHVRRKFHDVHVADRARGARARQSAL
jgi:transposase-like protein